MRESKVLATLDSCDEMENRHSKHDELDSAVPAHTGNGNEPVLQCHGNLAKLTPTTDSLMAFKSQRECVIDQSEAADITEAQRAREIQQGEAEMTALEAKLQVKDKSVPGKNTSRSELPESFAVKIRELEDLLRVNDKLLQSRDTGLEDLQAKISVSMIQVTRLESLIQHLRTAALGETQRTQEIEEKYAALEATLREKEDSAQASTVTQLRESFNTKVRMLENQLQVKDQLLQNLAAELKQNKLPHKIEDDDAVKLRECMSAEVQKLTAELREKKIALASYEKSHWRSIGRRNFWARIVHGKRLWKPSSSTPSHHPGTDDRTGSTAPSTRNPEEQKKPLVRPNMVDSQRLNPTQLENPIKTKKIVNF